MSDSPAYPHAVSGIELFEQFERKRIEASETAS